MITEQLTFTAQRIPQVAWQTPTEETHCVVVSVEEGFAFLELGRYTQELAEAHARRINACAACQQHAIDPGPAEVLGRRA